MIETKEVMVITCKAFPEMEVPEEELGGFADWVKSQGHICGVGRHHEYYAYDADYHKDIPVELRISMESLK